MDTYLQSAIRHIEDHDTRIGELEIKFALDQMRLWLGKDDTVYQAVYYKQLYVISTMVRYPSFLATLTEGQSQAQKEWTHSCMHEFTVRFRDLAIVTTRTPRYHKAIQLTMEIANLLRMQCPRPPPTVSLPS